MPFRAEPPRLRVAHARLFRLVFAVAAAVALQDSLSASPHPLSWTTAGACLLGAFAAPSLVLGHLRRSAGGAAARASGGRAS